MNAEADLKPRSRAIALVPLALFAILAAVFLIGLYGDPSSIPSTMIGREAPAFELPPLEGSQIPGLTSQDLKGKGVSIVNIWASWCVPCRYEHPQLVTLSQRKDIRLLGINNKDKPADALRFLGSLGQPFAAIGADTSGRVSIDWGGYGVPETFIVDDKGIVRFKWTGPITPEILEKLLLPEIEKAAKPAA